MHPDPAITRCGRRRQPFPFLPSSPPPRAHVFRVRGRHASAEASQVCGSRAGLPAPRVISALNAPDVISTIHAITCNVMSERVGSRGATSWTGSRQGGRRSRLHQLRNGNAPASRRETAAQVCYDAFQSHRKFEFLRSRGGWAPPGHARIPLRFGCTGLLPPPGSSAGPGGDAPQRTTDCPAHNICIACPHDETPVHLDMPMDFSLFGCCCLIELVEVEHAPRDRHTAARARGVTTSPAPCPGAPVRSWELTNPFRAGVIYDS